MPKHSSNNSYQLRLDLRVIKQSIVRSCFYKTNLALPSGLLIVQHFLLIPLFFLFLFTHSNNSIAEHDGFALANALFMNEELGRKLSAADENRLANPKLFRQLLSELTEQTPHFTPAHQYYFDYLQGYHLAYIGKHNEAEKRLKAILNSSASTLLKFRTIHTLINLSAINQKWADGLQYIDESNQLAADIDNMEHVQSNLLAITPFYIQLKQYDSAQHYIAKLEQHDLSPHNACFTKQYDLATKFHLQQLTTKNTEISEGLEICINANNQLGTNFIRVYQAKLYLAEKSPYKALAVLLPQTKAVEMTLSPILIAAINNIIAQAYLQLNDMENAKQFATKTTELNKQSSGVKHARDSYQILYQIAERQKNVPLALTYYKKFALLDKTYLNEVKAKNLAFQLAVHNSLNQASKIQLLNRENSLLTMEQYLTETKIQSVQLAVSVVALLLIMLAIWGARLWYRHHQVKLLSECDDLTGIYNRRHFTYITVNALKYCKAAQQELSLIMFDLDKFKEINDRYGHACGDWVLKETIRVCQGVGHNNDIFARLGGEELCLVLPCCKIEIARVRAEICRVAIEKIITEASGRDFSVTASFGVTDIHRSGFRLSELLKDADSAMHVAKESGRNQVTLFEEKTPAKDNP